MMTATPDNPVELPVPALERGTLPEIKEQRRDTLENDVAAVGEASALPAVPKTSENHAMETPVDPWRHLVRRRHTWRRQLYIKGRNMTAWQLVRSKRASKFNEEETADDYDLPVEAVREALLYVEKDRKLIDVEDQIERLMLSRGEVARGPQPLAVLIG